MVFPVAVRDAVRRRPWRLCLAQVAGTAADGEVHDRRRPCRLARAGSAITPVERPAPSRVKRRRAAPLASMPVGMCGLASAKLARLFVRLVLRLATA